MKSAEPLSIAPFISYLQFEKRYSLHTVTAYETDITAFIAYHKSTYGSMQWADISGGMVRSWMASLKEAGMTSKTINRKISSIRSLFKYLLKTGEIRVMPTSKLVTPRQGKRLPVFVKESETAAIIETLNSAAEDWNSLNAKMLVGLFYATGMRLSELITLKGQQVDEGRGQIKVLGKGNKERIIPISNEMVENIRLYQALKKKEFGTGGDQEVLLVTGKGKKLYPKYAYLLVKSTLAEAGTLEKRSPHVLRHTFATHLMNNGADLNAVKELLGHSSLAATQVYTHNTIDKLRDIHRKAHPKA